jgi:putative copper resistance protein D
MPHGWDLAASAAKLAIHAGLAGACGAALLLLLFPERSGDRRGLVTYGVIGAGLGIAGSLLYFLVQIGTVMGAGPAGMFDGTMAAVLWSTALGTSLAFRIGGFLLAALALPAYARFDRIDDGPALPRRLALGLVMLAAALLVAAGSASAGHTAVIGPLAQFGLLVHAVAAAVWVGSLPPLLRRVRQGEPPVCLADALRRFGDVARWAVVLVLIAGAWSVLRLVELPKGLWASPWGLLLCGKVVLTGGLLVLAALNRGRWVPALAAHDRESDAASTAAAPPRRALRRSILAELVLAGLVLILTGQLSTVYGPDGNH